MLGIILKLNYFLPSNSGHFPWSLIWTKTFLHHNKGTTRFNQHIKFSGFSLKFKLQKISSPSRRKWSYFQCDMVEWNALFRQRIYRKVLKKKLTQSTISLNNLMVHKPILSMSQFSTSWALQKRLHIVFSGFHALKNWAFDSEWVMWVVFSMQALTRNYFSNISKHLFAYLPIYVLFRERRIFQFVMTLNLWFRFKMPMLPVQ